MSKKQPKLTPWFPPEVKPVRAGLYETRTFPGFSSLRHWNGSWFGCVFDMHERSASSDDFEWRGLAEPPK